MRKRYLLLFLTLFFGLALLAVDRYTEQLSPDLSEQQHHEPDYYGEQLYSRQYNTQGQLSQSFRATSSVHYPETQSTLFSQPVLRTTDADGETWQVTAKEGTLSDHENILRLISQVEIRPDDAEKNDQLIISTDSLTYNHKSGIAETDDPVSITSRHSQIDAVGMSLDVARQRLHLNAQVNTRYVP